MSVKHACFLTYYTDSLSLELPEFILYESVSILYLFYRYNRLARDWTQKYAMWECQWDQNTKKEKQRNTFDISRKANEQTRIIKYTTPHLLEKEAIQWGTVPPGFPCAELLPCAILRDLYGSAEQDLTDSWKHSHMEYWNLFTVHTATLRLLTVTSAIVIITISVTLHTLIISTVDISHIIVLLKSKMSGWFRRFISPAFQRYCLCPTGCLVLLYFHVFSGLSVLLLFLSGRCAIEAECSLFSTKWCVAITSSWSVVRNRSRNWSTHTVSTPKQCERSKEGLVFITHCIWKCNRIHWFWRYWIAAATASCPLLLCRQKAMGNVPNQFSHPCCHCTLISFSVHPWLVS